MKLVLIGVLLCLSLNACRRPDSDFVSDPAALLIDAQRSRIASFHRALLEDLDIHFRLVILPSASSDINRDAVALFEDFHLGESTRGARGVLLLVDPEGEQVRLEIGYDLEGVFPDGFVGYVEEQQLAPFFAAGQVGNGIEATVELLTARALEEDGAFPGKDPTPPSALSGGGGARVDVAIGNGSSPFKPLSSQPFPAASTPEETLNRYRQVLLQGVRDPNLGIYSIASRALLGNWLVTEGQQQQELRRLEQALESYQVRSAGEHAVIRFPVEERQLPPYFFTLSDSGWQLDFVVMADHIGFNHKNQWHFRNIPEAYAFAFNDWRFDQQGFPHQR